MIVEVKNGTFSYGHSEPILKDINFQLKERQILTILGQNGIGKISRSTSQSKYDWRGNGYRTDDKSGNESGNWICTSYAADAF